MRSKSWILFSLLLIAMFVLAACRPLEAGTPAPGAGATAVPTPAVEPTTAVEPTVPLTGTAPATGAVTPGAVSDLSGTITLWHAWKEAEIVGLNEVIANFQKQYPNVRFDVLYTPDTDLRGKFETAAASGSGPTVMISIADWVPAFYDAGLVADLSGEIDQALLDTISPAALGAVQYKGALIGLPQTIKGVIMYRNKAIIPNAPASFDDLVTAAKAATQGDVVGADLERAFFFSAGHLVGIGGKILEENGDPAFNNEQGVAWINLLQRFSEAGPTEYLTDNDVNLFKAGRAGIIIDGTWNMTSLAESIGAENLAIDPWPSYEGGNLSGFVQTEDIVLNENAQGADREAGLAFIRYFLSQEAQTTLVKIGHIPAVEGVEVTDPLMAQAVTAFEDGVTFPVIPEMSAYWEPMETALKSVFDQGADPKAALDQAEQSIQARIEDIRAQ